LFVPAYLLTIIPRESHFSVQFRPGTAGKIQFNRFFGTFSPLFSILNSRVFELSKAKLLSAGRL